VPGKLGGGPPILVLTEEPFEVTVCVALDGPADGFVESLIHGLDSLPVMLLRRLSRISLRGLDCNSPAWTGGDEGILRRLGIYFLESTLGSLK
jgi:hypothetical protein